VNNRDAGKPRSDKPVKSPRAVALDALVAYETGGFWSADKLHAAISRAGLNTRDAAFTLWLCGTVLRNRSLLDYNLTKYSKIKLSKLETRVLCLLRLGAAQLIFSLSVPAHAAINESVLLSGRRASGYVNGVLRSLSSSGDYYHIAETDPVKRCAIRYSHAEWIVEEAFRLFGESSGEELLKSASEAPLTELQVNTLRTTPEECTASLVSEEVSVSAHPLMPGCLIVGDTGDITRLSAFKKGWFWVQDSGARAVSAVLSPKFGENFLDICASPGGKSFATAVEAGCGIHIASCDFTAEKVSDIRDGALRLGIELQAAVCDGRNPPTDFYNAFDIVLCDAPCSGLGVIRRKPDIRYKDKSSVDALPALQRDILRGAVKCLKTGGRLVYSTCTWRTEENEDVARALMREYPRLRTVPFETPFGAAPDGMLTLLPQIHGTDGFFICLMENSNA
jgi:16S rRNA (cytosine967-C5)-methyltransferase